MNNGDIESAEAENAKEAVKKALEILGEHFDAVQILGSHQTVEGETVSAFWGIGNWHTRTGLVTEFLEQGSARNFAWEMRKADDDD